MELSEIIPWGGFFDEYRPGLVLEECPGQGWR
jgi:hypothetical protein